MTNLPVSRRQMIGGSVALGLSTLVSNTTAEAVPKMQKKVPGVQLYTVRDSMASDVPGTLKAIAGIGYKEVEFAGYGDHSPEQVRKLLDELGLSSPSSHVLPNMLRDDPMPMIDVATAVGNNYLTIAWLHPDDRKTIDDYKRWAETFNRVGELCRDNGIRLGYHNHDFELLPMDGQRPFDVLLKESDPDLMDFELDMYWVRKAGLNVLDVLNLAPERFTMAHIKDMDDEGNFTEVGTGIIDFESILGDKAAAGIRHLFVEHDQPDDPFKSVAISHLALSSILE